MSGANGPRPVNAVSDVWANMSSAQKREWYRRDQITAEGTVVLEVPLDFFMADIADAASMNGEDGKHYLCSHLSYIWPSEIDHLEFESFVAPLTKRQHMRIIGILKKARAEIAQPVLQPGETIEKVHENGYAIDGMRETPAIPADWR